ncbi:MAG TPA: ElyC/SanA/YdcF family protein [Nitrospirota bacterium]|nr:ElyC/SanA/YdcF family protein [Nitrospirota bacterium]
MNKYLLKKRPLILSISVFTILCGLFISVETVPGHKELYSLLIEHLSRVEPLLESPQRSPSQSDNVIYVMGGSQADLDSKAETAAAQYHLGLSKKILSLSRPGITEYDHTLGRDLTNDEWFVNKLVARSVKKEDIELVILQHSSFGTLTESKGIAQIASERGYTHLILVTSLHHTMRTWLAFSNYVKGRGIVLSMYASNYHASLYELLFEYCKLVLYRYDLLAMHSSTSSVIVASTEH